MIGRLELTPWARAVLTPEDRVLLRSRIPAGHTLFVGGRGPYLARLIDDHAGVVRERRSADVAVAIAEALTPSVTVPVSYLRCATCGKRLGDYGECDSCTFDRAEEEGGQRDG